MKLLIIRFSAMGDVAMTVPIVYACAVDHPDVQITVVSRSFLKPLFAHMPENVTFCGIDLKEKRYKGLRGLNTLYRELAADGYDAVADFHDVLRTKYLRFRFWFAGKRVAHIFKGRHEKKLLTQTKNKRMVQLKSSFKRYEEVLNRLGLKLHTSFTSIYAHQKENLADITAVTGVKGTSKWVGIAPFAAHRGKEYGVENLGQVIALLAQCPDVRIFIFGAGSKEQAVAESWQQTYPQTVVPMIGKLRLDGELNLISQLDVLVSMDSANMHLASLVATPVISIWGATHPYAGFLGWGQRSENVVQVDLPCRPCSVYGNKPCLFGNYPCLNQIAPATVVAYINRIIRGE